MARQQLRNKCPECGNLTINRRPKRQNKLHRLYSGRIYCPSCGWTFKYYTAGIEKDSLPIVSSRVLEKVIF